MKHVKQVTLVVDAKFTIVQLVDIVNGLGIAMNDVTISIVADSVSSFNLTITRK